MNKALKRISLHNFQSHEDTTLDLSSGVNIIVGPSDVGKTSVIRALRWLYYNQPRGSSFIRMGTSDCWVEVETEEQIIVRRYRNEAARKNGYLLIIPGQEPMVFEKHGMAVPEEIKLALGVDEILIDQDVVMNLNLAYQLEGAFLLETPGTTRAKAIGRLGDAHIVDAAQREIQKDLRAVNQEIDQKQKQFKEEEKLLAAYAHLESWKLALQELDALFAQKQDQENLQKQLSNLFNQYVKARQQLEDLSPYLQQLNQIKDAEDCQERLREKYNLAAQLTKLQQQHDQKRSDYGLCFELLQQTAVLPTVQDVFNRIEALAAAVRTYEELLTKHVSTRQKLDKVRQNIAATEHLEDASAALYLTINHQAAVISMNQLYNSLLEKKQGLKHAGQQLEATDKLNQAEAILEKLVLQREQGLAVQNQWREHSQRHDRLQQIKSILFRLEQCRPAEDGIEQLLLLNQQQRTMGEYQTKWAEAQVTLKLIEQRLFNLESGYQQDTEQYLACLAQVGQCPVCHGNIDDQHIQELRVQLEGEWRNEQ
ncbi:MAG: AAA family ATPase [Methylocystaceae bacterium]